MSHHYEENYETIASKIDSAQAASSITGLPIITTVQARVEPNKPTPDTKKILDSGQRQDFGTGSVRDTNEGKGRFDLLPFYSMLKLAQHFEEGAKKYAADNWRKGQPLSRYFDSAQRHMAKFAMGFQDEPHLSAAIWNLMCYVETAKRIEMGQLDGSLNDFPRVNMEFSTDKKI